jgi:hypothetical protein
MWACLAWPGLSCTVVLNRTQRLATEDQRSGMASLIAGLQEIDHAGLLDRMRSSFHRKHEGEEDDLFDHDLVVQRSQLEIIFSLIDMDGGGTLGREEMLEAMQTNPLVARALDRALDLKPGTNLVPEIRRLFEVMDVDGDNSIDCGEFVSYFIKGAHKQKPAIAAHGDILEPDLGSTPQCPDGPAAAAVAEQQAADQRAVSRAEDSAELLRRSLIQPIPSAGIRLQQTGVSAAHVKTCTTWDGWL